jgi:hypothetical protein
MRTLLAILAAVLLSNCAFFQPYTEPVSKVDPVACKALPDAAKAVCKEAGDVLVKGYVSIAAANGTIAKKKKSGEYTEEQKNAYLDKTLDARKRLDKAHDVFKKGNYAEALSQANVINTLLTTLTAELAKQVAKEKK